MKGVNEEFNNKKKYETTEEVKARLRKKFPNIKFPKNVITEEMVKMEHIAIDGVFEREGNKNNKL